MFFVSSTRPQTDCALVTCCLPLALPVCAAEPAGLTAVLRLRSSTSRGALGPGGAGRAAGTTPARTGPAPASRCALTAATAATRSAGRDRGEHRPARLAAAATASRKRRSGPRSPLRPAVGRGYRSEEHTSELQSLMRISYAVFCLKKKNNKIHDT